MERNYLTALANLKEDIEKKLQSFDYLHARSAIYISDYFYSIRNEVDIQAETLLAVLSLNKDENETERQARLKLEEERQREKKMLARRVRLHFDEYEFGDFGDDDDFDENEFTESVVKHYTENIELNEQQINERRSIIIEELNKHEKICLNNEEKQKRERGREDAELNVVASLNEAKEKLK